MTTPSSRLTRYAETSRRLVTRAGAVVLQANDEISEGTFGSAQWAKSANQLVNLALTAGLQFAPQMMPFPCLPKSTEEFGLSDFIEVGTDNECERVLSVAGPFVHDGAPSCVIPEQTIVFVPGIVRVYAKRFRVRVNWPNLRSGTYRGRVSLTRVQAATAQVSEMDVIIDL
jgi:hypothetical protein